MYADRSCLVRVLGDCKSRKELELAGTKMRERSTVAKHMDGMVANSLNNALPLRLKQQLESYDKKILDPIRSDLKIISDVNLDFLDQRESVRCIHVLALTVL
jgi:hypothetical protein